MAKKNKEWKVMVVKGRGVTTETIKVKQQPVEKSLTKSKDKLDLILEETQGIKQNLKRCEGKIDKLKKEK